MEAVFDTLAGVNVNEHTDKKNKLTYLSWPWAWAEVKKLYPNASYTIWKSPLGLPYVYDELTGFMVYTSVTIESVTHEMWLPVMDSKNDAMKAKPYEYSTKYGKKEVAAATMFDINKTIMRCLVKNLAMFGLGLYIYAGEDLPEAEKTEEPKPQPQPTAQEKAVIEADAKARVMAYVNKCGMSKEDIAQICKSFKVESLNQINLQQAQYYINFLKSKGINVDE